MNNLLSHENDTYNISYNNCTTIALNTFNLLINPKITFEPFIVQIPSITSQAPYIFMESPQKLYKAIENFPQALMAARATLKTAQAGLINSGFSQTHFNFIVSNLPAPVNNTNYNLLFDVWFTIYCINTKLEHQEWSNTRVYLAATLEVVHILLDVGGMVPVIGEVAELTNGVVSQPLKDRILEENCTGIIFREVNERYP
ncbi:MAG: hypothetical protein IPL97_00115 [Niastella sp.]|nr:hypothetical protein [Niastella sp.]